MRPANREDCEVGRREIRETYEWCAHQRGYEDVDGCGGSPSDKITGWQSLDTRWVYEPRFPPEAPDRTHLDDHRTGRTLSGCSFMICAHFHAGQPENG